jgi:hypothetical protein
MNILKKHPWAEKAAAERSLQQAGRDVTFSEALSTSAMSAGEISMTYETVRCPDEFAPWSDLEECYKESYRSQIRFLGEKLQDYDMQIGLRPIAGSGAPDAITELFGPVLEEFARLEHERWMRDRRIAGWTAGSPNADLKQTPELVSYDELDEMTRSFIRMQVREIPGQLREIGYELYFKWK